MGRGGRTASLCLAKYLRAFASRQSEAFLRICDSTLGARPSSPQPSHPGKRGERERAAASGKAEFFRPTIDREPLSKNAKQLWDVCHKPYNDTWIP
jgi:hypothetical protein